MITKEKYLQAKKTIADYELQEYLSGISGLLDLNKTLTNVGGLWWESKPAGHIGPDVIRKVKEEAAARGYVKGAKVNGETLTGTLVDMLTYDGRYIIHGRTESGGTVFIHDMRDNSWAELDPKSPLQEAMDRGYRKGAVVNVYGEMYKLVFDPVLSGKMVIAYVQGSKDWYRFDMPIWMEGVGYLFELETEASESPVNNK